MPLAAPPSSPGLAAGCGDDDEAAAPEGAEQVNLILDWFPNADHAGVYGAIEEDYFAEEGLDVSAVVPSDPAASLKQVGTGKAPFAISYEPEVLIARSAGVPVVAVGAVAVHPLNSVIVRTDRGISRPTDLEGKTVGVAGVPSDRPLLDAVVRADGGDPARVETRNVGFNLSPALAAGKVDAVIGAYWNIELVELERQGIAAEAFRLEEHGVPDYDELVVVTSDEIARDVLSSCEAFLRGLRAGQDWAATDQAGAVEHLVGRQPRPRRRGREGAARPDRRPPLPPRRAARSTSPGGVGRPSPAWMRDNGLLEEPVDAERVVTDRFLPEEPA